MKSKVFKKALLKPVAMPDKPKSAGIDFRYRFKVFVCVKLLSPAAATTDVKICWGSSVLN